VIAAAAPNVGGDVGVRVMIGGFFTFHILTSGLISGAGQFGPAVEFLGYIRGRRRYDRMAHGLGKFLVYYFAISSAVAFVLVTVLLVGLMGRFWGTMTRVAYWPLFLELFSFIFEVGLVYLWYYSWEPLREHKVLHMCIGGLLMLASFLQVLMIDVVASYMLTPATDPQNLLRVMINPTEYPLQAHRIIGNLAYIGFAVAAWSGFKFLRAKDEDSRAFWDWAGSFGMLTGIILTLFQPMVGYSYAKEIQLHSYGAWYRMMLGQLSTVFLWQMTLLGIMFLVACVYFTRRLRRDDAPGHRLLFLITVGMVVTTLFAALPYHLAFTYADVHAAGLDKPFWEGGRINPFGAMIPYKVTALALYTLLAIAAVIWYLRGIAKVRWGNAGRGEQRLLVASVVLTAMMITTMGFIRENGRQPYLVYGEMTRSGQQYTTGQQAPPGSLAP